MRQCFNVIAQLEALKFVERAGSEGTSNKKDQPWTSPNLCGIGLIHGRTF